jgi:zinc finger SWIM domain-containing protein 3
MRINTHVWTEQIDRYHTLRRKGILAIFKGSKSPDETERLMKLFDDICKQDMQDGSTREETSFGPLPAHFSATNQPCVTKVLDLVKIIPKGAPRSNNKRWKASHEFWGIV